jgi:hypothetical protein
MARRFLILLAAVTSLGLVLAAVWTRLPLSIAEPLGILAIWLIGFAAQFGISYRELAPHLGSRDIEVLERAVLPFAEMARAGCVILLLASGTWVGLCSSAPLLSGAVFFVAFQLLRWAGKRFLPGPDLPSYGLTGHTIVVELAAVLAGVAVGGKLYPLVL